jgi:hypothetical protein
MLLSGFQGFWELQSDFFSPEHDNPIPDAAIAIPDVRKNERRDVFIAFLFNHLFNHWK